jgi:hypothetical protein
MLYFASSKTLNTLLITIIKSNLKRYKNDPLQQSDQQLLVPK